MRQTRLRGSVARTLVLAVLVVGAVVASAAPAVASGPIIIDNFTAGSGSWQTCGSSYFVYYQDPSIIGGARELALRDGGSCHFGSFPAQMSIDATHGTASWGGPNTYSPEQHFSYGTEIGTQANVSWSPNPNGGKGTPLHLSLSLSDEILIQMVAVNNPYLSIELRDGNGATYSATISLTVGTNLVPLSSFPGLTAAAASDIDGISFNGSNKNPTDVVSLFAIQRGDTDPPVAAPTQSPAANGAGWNNSDVTVNWNWSDSGSGIDASRCTTATTSSGEGSAIVLSSTCTDLAGNTGTATYTVKVDKTAPALAPTVSPNPLALNGPATVSANATDALSGIASAGCAPVDSSQYGSFTVACTATDNAGNSASASVSYDVTVQATKRSVLAGIQASLASASGHDQEALRQAARDLAASLAPSLWTDGNHAASKRVFEAEQEAADALGELQHEKHSSIAAATVQGWIDALVGADRALATFAITAAAGGDSEKLAEAGRELARGDSAAAAGRANSAIEHYADAWQQAQQATASHGGGDD
ncbi:MAG: hypothetical protein ACYDCH_07985 [Gaiellaceae bacterium]